MAVVGEESTRVRDRAAVVDALRGVLEQAIQTGAGTSACITGAAGMGKSHLIRSLLTEIDTDQLVATGDHRRRNEPFAVLEQLTGPTAPDSDPAEVAFDRIDERCAAGPLVVWVDDAHNADAASLAGLRRLIWASRSLPLVVLVSTRPTPMPEQLELLLRQVSSTFVLPPMNRMMVERLVFDRTGRWPGPRLRAVLVAGAGNPLFVGEMLRELTEAGTLAPDGAKLVEATETTVPRRALDALIRRHLDAVDESGTELLSALAVWGTAMALSDLGEVLYSEPDALRPALDRVVRTGIAQVESPDSVDFAHDLFREVFYAGVPADLQRRLHRRVAAVLTERGARPTLIAEHLLQAASTESASTGDGALLAALHGAVAQTRQYAPQVAADLLAVTGDLVESDGPAAEELLLARARELFQAGRGPAAERLVMERIRAVRDPAVAAGLQAVLITSQINRADVDGALASIARVLAITRIPDPVRRGLEAQRQWVLLLGGRLTEIADLDAMLVAARSAGDWAAEQTLVNTLACLAYVRGDVHRALELSDSLPAPTGSQLPEQSVNTTVLWPAMFRIDTEGPATVLAMLATLREQIVRHHSEWVNPFVGFLAGGVTWASGDWDGAVAELDAALEAAEETGTGWISIAVGERALIDARRGRIAAARTRLDAFHARELPEQFGRGEVALAEIAVLEAEGAIEVAGARAEAFWASARRTGAAARIDVAADIVRTAMLAFRPDLAEQVAADIDAAPHLDRLPGTLDLVHGCLHGDPDRIEAAVATFSRMGFGTRELSAWEELAVAAAARSDRPRAVRAMEEAVTGYERLRAVVDRDRLLARMRAHGIRRGPRETHRSASSGWESLTATEQRITGLIRQGLTNREIGARLFVSPRTVQTHVSHVLEKTGLRSRVEVAAAVR